MVPFKETINTKQELIEACKKGFEDYSKRRISKNDFCMFFGFTHGKAITTFYEGDYEQLLIDGGFNSGSSAYFSGGINAWKNLRDGKYVFPPFVQNDSKSHYNNMFPLQQIFYGAPGTGKSHEINEKTKKQSVIRTTFHPDTDYSTFVGAYKPTTIEEPVMTVIGTKLVPVENAKPEKKIIYEFVSQAFLQAYVGAWQKYAKAEQEEPKKQFLVIEEINRGNCAQIFGDLFQLLDRNSAGFSDYPITADADMKKQLQHLFEGCDIEESEREKINVHYEGQGDVVGKVLNGDILLLPNNMYIWATMNTSDQSLFPIDSAFKRRWNWTYIPISNRDQNYKIKVNDSFYDWWEFLKAINGKIWDANHSEDKKLGYFFVKADDGIIKPDIFVGKVIFYLWNDVFKDFIEESGGIFNDENGDTLSFDKFYETLKSGETKVVEKNVEQFLKNLGLTPIEISSEYSLAKFCLDGGNPLSMTMIAKQVVINFADSHTSFDANAIRDEFNTACDKIVVETESEYKTRIENNPNTYHGQEIVLANGEKLYVTNQWQWKSEQSNFAKFIRVAHERNWGEIVEFKQ